MASYTANCYLSDTEFNNIVQSTMKNVWKSVQTRQESGDKGKAFMITFVDKIETDDSELKRLKRWRANGARKGKPKPIPKFNTKPCKCGSHLHKSCSSKQCPLNKINIVSILEKLNLAINSSNIENYINSYYKTHDVDNKNNVEKTAFPLWTKHYEPDTGRRYYHNHLTKQKHYQCPYDDIHQGWIIAHEFNPDCLPEIGYKYNLKEEITFSIDLTDYENEVENDWIYRISMEKLNCAILAEDERQAIHKNYIDEMNARSKFLENIGCSKMFDCICCMEQKPLQKIYTNKCSCKAVVCNDCAIQVAKTSDFGDYTCPSCRSKSVFSVAL
jgi:hypothetical protein